MLCLHPMRLGVLKLCNLQICARIRPQIFAFAPGPVHMSSILGHTPKNIPPSLVCWEVTVGHFASHIYVTPHAVSDMNLHVKNVLC